MVQLSKNLRYNENTPADFDRYVEVTNNCHLWKGPISDQGYGVFYYHGTYATAHRYAWERVHGEADLLVLHSCDVRNCVKLSHLHLGTISDNIREAVERARFKRGENKPNAKLSEEAVRYIRANYVPYDKVLGTRALARKFGVPHTTIRGVIHYQTWNYVSEVTCDTGF